MLTWYVGDLAVLDAHVLLLDPGRSDVAQRLAPPASMPMSTASSKLFGDEELISSTLATLMSLSSTRNSEQHDSNRPRWLIPRLRGCGTGWDSIRAGAIVESTISLEIVPGERLVAHGWVTALVPA